LRNPKYCSSFLDIESVSDNVPSILIQKLEELYIRACICYFMANLDKETGTFVELDNKQDLFLSHKGILFSAQYCIYMYI